MARSKFVSVIFAAAVVLTGTGTSAAPAYTLYDSLGGVEGGGDSLAGVGPILNDWVAAGSAATLTSATFNLSLSGAPTGSFDVFVAKIDAKSKTGISHFQTIGTISDTSLTSSFATYTVSPTSKYRLDANSFYVVGLFDNAASNAIWGSTVDPTVLARPSVVAGQYYYNSTGGVQSNAGGPYELSVDVTNVPEPAALALLGLGIAGLAARRRRAA